MSTSTLTTVVDPDNNEDRKSSSQVILPTASGLPDRFPIRGRPEKRTEKRSRIIRPHTAATVPNAPYRWVDPFSWQDGARYSEDLLEQQLVNNMREVPHLIGVLQEDVVDSSGFGSSPYYTPVFPELTAPLGSNETWYFLEIIRFSGLGVSGTDQVRFGWYTPLGADMNGTGPTIDGNSNVYVQTIQLNATLTTELEWESATSIPAHQSGVQRCHWMEFYVTTGTAAGNLKCGFTSLTAPDATVYAGTCLMGMKVSP